MKSVTRFAIAAPLAAALLGADCNTTPESKPRPGSWLVLLCKAKDVTAEPHPPSYYEGVFSKSAPDLLFQYFDAISNHTVDMSGSRVRGWFTMNVTAAEIGPTARNNTTPIKRSQTAKDCQTAAWAGLARQGITVDPADYTGVIEVINTPVDWGKANFKDVVLSNNLDVDLTLAEHEMLHVYGLNHSWRMSADASADHVWGSGTDVEYYDCWDIMSARTCVSSFTTAANGLQGPGLQASYREKLNWLGPGQVFTPSRTLTTQTVTLRPGSDLTTPGFRLARIEVGPGAYVVDFRERAGFDRGISGSRVFVKEERTFNKLTYLVTRPNGAQGYTQGETFTDNANAVQLTVDNISPGSATLTLGTPAVAAGAWCGDIYRLQVRDCPAGLTCAHVRRGQLDTTDWFCVP